MQTTLEFRVQWADTECNGKTVMCTKEMSCPLLPGTGNLRLLGWDDYSTTQFVRHLELGEEMTQRVTMHQGFCQENSEEFDEFIRNLEVHGFEVKEVVE